MNIVDMIIIGLIALSVIIGFYRGFIQSVLNLGGCLISFLLSFWLYPKVADMISGNADLTRTIMGFTDSSSVLGDLDLAAKSVNSLGADNVSAVIEKANLPEPLGTILKSNIVDKVFSPLGQTSVSEYINQTIVSVSVNVLSFVLCFIACFIVISILINLVRVVFQFPVLKQMDWLVGGLFGFARGLVLCFVLFTIMPMIVSVVPIENFRTMVDESTLAKVFQNGGLIVKIMNRQL